MAMPWTMTQLGIMGWLLTNQKEFLTFLIGNLTFDELNHYLKIATKFLFPNNTIIKRPSGCGTRNPSPTNPCVSCGIFPKYNTVSTSSGMPSGHSQSMAFAATYWTLYLLEKNKGKPKSNLLYFKIGIIWLVAFGVFYQRWYSRCHNIAQIIVGGTIGILLGFLTHHITLFF